MRVKESKLILSGKPVPPLLAAALEETPEEALARRLESEALLRDAIPEDRAGRVPVAGRYRMTRAVWNDHVWPFALRNETRAWYEAAEIGALAGWVFRARERAHDSAYLWRKR